jgi:FtsH-binding integral membrane protein
MNRVFAWMAGGLLVSAATAHWVASSPTMLKFIYGENNFFVGLLILELGLVIALSWLIRRISPTTAAILFILYSFVSGLTLSVVVLEFTTGSLAATFISTAGMFGAMAAYGYFTGRDLSQMGSILLMALFGLIIASIVNLFVGNGILNIMISIIGIIIFAGLTAYDLQKIKEHIASAADEQSRERAAIYGALTLYLDFINIFLKLLSFMGKRRR